MRQHPGSAPPILSMSEGMDREAATKAIIARLRSAIGPGVSSRGESRAATCSFISITTKRARRRPTHLSCANLWTENPSAYPEAGRGASGYDDSNSWNRSHISARSETCMFHKCETCLTRDHLSHIMLKKGTSGKVFGFGRVTNQGVS